jgi:hypothetical protein
LGIFGVMSFLDVLLYGAFSVDGLEYLQAIPFYAFGKAMIDIKMYTVGPDYEGYSCARKNIIYSLQEISMIHNPLY